MSKLTKFGLFLFLSVALFLVVFPNGSYAASDNTLEQIYKVFTDNRDSWLTKMGTLLQWTFFTLLTISFVWKFAQLALSEQLGLGSILHLVVKTGMFAGFFKFIFMNIKWSGGNVMPLTLIPESFIWIARQVTGIKVNVFDFLATATQVFEGIINAGGGWGEVAVLCAVGIFVSVMFYMIVGQMILAMVETIMVTLAGFVLLVFDGLMDMFDYWKLYLRALIACGFKLFMLNIVCGILLKFGGDMTPLIQSNGAWQSAMLIAGVVCVMYLIAKNVPALVAATLSASPASTTSGVIGRAINTAATAAATAVAMKTWSGMKTAGDVGVAAAVTPFAWAGAKMFNKAPEGTMAGMDDGSKG